MKVHITQEELSRGLDIKNSAYATRLTDTVNVMADDLAIRDSFLDNLVGYASILHKYPISAETYAKGIQFISYRSLGDTVRDSWVKSNRSTYRELLQGGFGEKEVCKRARAFSRRKFVADLSDHEVIPAHIAYNDVFHKAIMTNAGIMQDKDASFHVRAIAASSLINKLAPPEIQKQEIKHEIVKSTLVEDIKQLTMADAQKKLDSLKSGAITLEGIAVSKDVVTRAKELAESKDNEN